MEKDFQTIITIISILIEHSFCSKVSNCDSYQSIIIPIYFLDWLQSTWMNFTTTTDGTSVGIGFGAGIAAVWSIGL